MRVRKRETGIKKIQRRGNREKREMEERWRNEKAILDYRDFERHRRDIRGRRRGMREKGEIRYRKERSAR